MPDTKDSWHSSKPPRWTASLYSQVVHPISDFGIFDFPLLGRFRAEYSYRDFIFLAQDLDPNLTEGPVHLLNFVLGLKPDDERWEATLWMQNTLDEEYGTVGLDIPITSGFAVLNAPPRTYGGTIRLFF